MAIIQGLESDYLEIIWRADLEQFIDVEPIVVIGEFGI
jgi:hypothetical protein